MNQTKATEIWVFVELEQGNIHPSTLELLAKAHDLSVNSNHQTVSAVLLETNQTDHASTLIGHGADQVILVKDDQFETFDPTFYKSVIKELAEKYTPAIFLFGATFKGRALAPRVQGALQTGLTADCLELSINAEGQLVQIKPSYGDNLMCTILIPNHFPQMTTVRPSVFQPLDFDENRKGTVIEETVTLKREYTYEVLESFKKEKQVNSIQDAERIVAVGRGMKSQDNLVYTERVAELLNAKIGATRPLSENGWYTPNEQIGQSGVTIQPELLLNFGIAGAIQYTVGMNNSKFVFSVNKDENATIFKESDYGYVGDATAFAKALNKLLEE